MTHYLLALLLMLSSCVSTKKGKPADPDNSTPIVTEPTPTQPSLPEGPEPEPILEPSAPVEQPVQPAPTKPLEPVEAPKSEECIKTNIVYFGKSATEKRTAKYGKAIETFKKVVCSKEFKTRVINHKYSGAIGYAYMSGDPNKTTTKVYEHILAGNEKLQPLKDNEVDMEVEFYYANNSTVGYTYANVKRIYVNTKFFDSYKPSSVAANLIHEWLHKLGYGHDSKSTSRRPYSVPYGVGSIMRSLGAKFD